MLLPECVGGRVDAGKYLISYDQVIIPQFLSSRHVDFAQTTASKLVDKTNELEVFQGE